VPPKKKPDTPPQYSVGDRATVSLHTGRLVDATIRAIVERTESTPQDDMDTVTHRRRSLTLSNWRYLLAEFGHILAAISRPEAWPTENR
jgi:hypothetical protein